MERKYKTMEDIGLWIEDNCPTYDTYTKVNNAIHWFVSVMIARSYSEITTKEMASLILNGIKPIDRETINAYIDNYYEDYGDDANDLFTNDLQLHFKPNGE